VFLFSFINKPSKGRFGEHQPTMSLDPRDSRTRGRSKSPGRRDSSRSRGGGEEEREHSRVRAPSPPSSRYEYEEQETRTVRGGREREPDIVTAEPRGYGSLSQYRDKSPAPGARERERDPYAVPGGFREEERDVRYNDGRGAPREKDYYKETSYERETEYKDEYGRPTSPPSRERYEYEREREREKERDPRRY
jgi:hypothetical protein